ncbi:MAG TPA: type 4a pilus biogenesis protein PilO [Gammaproteobacteria bacterium]|nr:type 4a pilus biogenesis protein PilO [Gammaproteobacteria bacterium]
MNFNKLHLNLNFSQITFWSKPTQFFCFTACYLTLSLIFYLFVYSPLNTQRHHNAIFITQLTKEFNDKQQLIRTEKSITQNKQTKAGLFELNKLQSQRLSHLLTQLVALANENRLEFDTIKPLPLESANNLQIQPIQVSTSGHYQQLQDFFSQLPHLDSINSLGDFSIKPLPSTGDDVAPKTLQLTLIINLYSKANQP